MHHLMRRTALAIVGAGLGVAAAVTMAAGPSFAQAPEEEASSASYLLFYLDDFDVPSTLEAGDNIEGSGYLAPTTNPTQNQGSFAIECEYLNENNWSCSNQLYLTGQGQLHFTFGADIDPSTGIISMQEREDADLSGGTGAWGAVDSGSAWFAAQTDGSLLWQHTVWLALPNA